MALIRWPWRRDLTAQTAPRNYGELIDQMVYWLATGARGEVDVRLSGVLESASRLYQSAFAGTQPVSGSGVVAAALSADQLGQAGRDYIQRGEAVFLIHTRPELQLEPVIITDAHGRPGQVTYTVRREGPDESIELETGGQDIIHAIFERDSARPYIGTPPWISGGHAARAVAALERWIGDEAGGSQGWTFASAFENSSSGGQGAAPTERQSRQVRQTGRARFGDTRGEVVPLPTQHRPLMHANSVGPAPGTADRLWRFGPEFANPAPMLYQQLRAVVAASCGVPPLLLSDAAGGPAVRDAYRWWISTQVAPLTRVLAAELTRKLGAEVRLELPESRTADIQSRARAVHSLTQSGVKLEQALELTGLA